MGGGDLDWRDGDGALANSHERCVEKCEVFLGGVFCADAWHEAIGFVG